MSFITRDSKKPSRARVFFSYPGSIVRIARSEQAAEPARRLPTEAGPVRRPPAPAGDLNEIGVQERKRHRFRFSWLAPAAIVL
jgi:hypothetical protein